ncbi:winged helix-turn-helix domain-containing protein [Shewanella pneumatophori]|uniref:Winged helix-turn-helix domain-containing protein n=1 Tax=Shewanella pneumatophori TaxID=314092 RepID=A0A9X2CGT4_9GAMM|nr:winged helix-turn-helix domain-containing protein [Shewanella pneumatophori]MCL1137779.1 winged helix-turn-helix domain-containing protein [Shewanella pneumatophori]
MSLNFTESKQQKAFLRKLYIAYLIDSERHNLLSLHKLTNMPRRTLQDAIAVLGDLAIECEFVQDGERNNAGFYRINQWGAINREWVELHLAEIEQQLA